jgi:REase_DpnII-MboI
MVLLHPEILYLFAMTEMEWALFGIQYLSDARASIHDEFNDVMKEIREYAAARTEPWYPICKNIIQSLYHYSLEFTASKMIPSSEFSSPASFASELVNYRAFVTKMITDLDEQTALYEKTNEVSGPPFLVSAACKMATRVLESIDYVFSQKPPSNVADGIKNGLELIVQLSRRFHEAVLSLKIHPHGGSVWQVSNEWDCQYLFGSILAVYFPDVRKEEWNPSVAGSSARCEFFIKPLRMMIELKFARDPKDQKKFKQELAADLLDYGANSECDHVVALIYDPQCHLADAVALQSDLSGPTKGLKDVRIVISPPRD